jgi:hypothetical protein
MTARRILVRYAAIALVVSLPFVIIHLLARPDDAPITPIQHLGAAVANFFGPWGVALVRLVDFPNAGLRSFSWALAIGLTLVGGLLVWMGAGIRAEARLPRYALMLVWGMFVAVWFGIGLGQIADGLL